ncbi:hypothetical protein [Streptomyces hokutonensis]|uniref:Resolvase/invertase-type recombinase catalytic domain-containing protein n=1 Tax=Streptomyces hokutonensis TaxID=1306990 RepID=A0ABW6M7Z0_9ACTN
MRAELTRPVNAGAEPVGHVRLGCGRASTARRSLDAQLDSLAEAGVTRVFAEKISTRATKRPELAVAVELAGELKAGDAGLKFLIGELKGSHDPSGIVFTVFAAMSGTERQHTRDRTLEGHESARKRGKTIGGAGVTDDSMLSLVFHLRDQEMSVRDIAKRLVITSGMKKGLHPSPATVMRMLREHDEQTATAANA